MIRIDKNLLLTIRSIGVQYSQVKGYFRRKIRDGDTIGQKIGTDGCPS